MEKRGRVVEMIKATPEYRAYARARPAADRLKDEPRTPEATDQAVSKRQWEHELQQWRAGLRQWCRGRCPSPEAPAAAPEAEPAPAHAATAAHALGEASAHEHGAPHRCRPSVLELLQRQGWR